MTNKQKAIVAFGATLIVIGIVLFFIITPSGRKTANEWAYELYKVDETTMYSMRKQVEDTCRAMISSYTSDKLTYEQYKDSGDKEKVSWAEQAKMRANKTAASYNEYILKNSYVWNNNIPADIKTELEYIR